MRYRYTYQAETQTTMMGAAEDMTKLNISATVLIDVLDMCEMSLKVSDLIKFGKLMADVMSPCTRCNVTVYKM